MDINNFIRRISPNGQAEEIGLNFTLLDDGSKSFSLIIGGHSISVQNDDVHVLTLAELVSKYVDGN